jgi:glycosyltransferase involved in cell wall biosynthesis
VSHFHPHASGAERQALAQGVEMAKRGHEVHVVTRFIAGMPEDDEFQGIRIHRWVKPSTKGPLFAVSFVAGVIRALMKLRPNYDLIHTHQALWEAVATGLGRDLFEKAPILVQPASSGFYGEAEELSRTKGFRVLRRLAIRNPMFAAISADIARQWHALGVPKNRIVRTASGVDAEHFRPGPSSVAASLPAGPKVLFTGRLHPQKNLDVLIDAWPDVMKSSPASLVLVGDGVDRQRLESKAKELGIADSVHFTGAQADPAEFLRAADLFVLPSVAEGMSNSLLEAMASGLPCVASEIGGNTDLLDQGRTGWLAAPEDRPGWTAAILRVLQDPALGRFVGGEARRRIEEEFAMPVVVDRYIKIYRQMIAREIPPVRPDP